MHPDLLIVSCYLRPHPVLVGELRAWATATGAELPWYYTQHQPDAADDQPARFVPFTTARRVVEWLGETLPQSYAWAGLSADLPWGVEPPDPPAQGHAEQVFEQLREWSATNGAAWSFLQAVLLAPMCAIDKFRVCVKVRDAGLCTDLVWLQSVIEGQDDMADLATARTILSATELDRIGRDLRSVAHLAGLQDVEPDALWLSPYELAEPDDRFDLHTLGAIGSLRHGIGEDLQPLVPGQLAWADVVAWPGTLLNSSELDEEAPQWG